MSNFVIVRVNDKLVPEFLIKYNPNQKIAKKSNITSWADIKQAGSEKIIILLSANLVFSTQVKIPSKNDEIIKQSIPYAIEEELATDIDLNHFSYNKGSSQGMMVSVVSVNIIQEIIVQLKQHNITCETMYSEVYSCPHQAEMTTICTYKDYVVIRDDKNGTTINPKMLNNYLKLSTNKQIVIFSGSKLKIEKQINLMNKVTDMVLLQAQTLFSSDSVNLLQGEYAQNNASKNNINPWKKIAILMLLLIGSWLFINVYHLWKLTGSIENLKNSQQSLFTKLIPNASQTELNDPYSSMLSRLKLNQQSQSNNNNKGFIQALIYVGKTLQQNPTIEIMSLRQRKGKLEVKLQAPEVTSLNKFQQSLEKTAYSMRVKTGTRDSNKDGFSSIITMEQL